MWGIGNVSNTAAKMTRPEDDSDLFYYLRFVLIEKALKSGFNLAEKQFRLRFWKDERGDRKLVHERAAGMGVTVRV